MHHGDGQLLVSKVFSDTPAARSGAIHEGDRLVAVRQGNQQPVDVRGMTIQKVVSLIRGAKGSLVTLTIVPLGKADSEAIVIPFTRAATKELNRFGDGHYIAKGTLPPNFKAIGLAANDAFELNSSVGKLIVLEFWARWCAPCHKSLDDLQECRIKHPEWKDRVQLIAVAVDDEKRDASECFRQRGRGWKDIYTVWAGPSILRSFHISGLPTIYVLDESGRVIAAGEMNVSSVIGNALRDETHKRAGR